MASIGSACRLSARVASRQLRNARGYRTSSASLAAHNFSMPAMSPTMTEGNIASWKLKEGDSFSAGDVILEIETDKAQMDVEAQDDGILAKILQGDGSKAVAVGTRIAVLADPGDDISSLEIPAESSASTKKEDSKPAESSSAPASKQDSPTASPSADKKTPQGHDIGVKGGKQTYPLYPSVSQLLHENGLSKTDADKIPATGPQGRLLKGDVLAYLGKIASNYSAEQSKRIEKLGHLDLSNIKIAAPPARREAPAVDKAAKPQKEIPQETEISIPISLTAVLECQKRVQESLGIHLPTVTFISRAIELANEDLPRSKSYKPTADDLFNSVLGIKSSRSTSQGAFIPEITALAATAPFASRQARKSKQADIFDILSGKSKAPKSVATSASYLSPQPPIKGAINLFSVSATKGDEKRAEVFLERVKTVLEAEPGRLVL